MIVVTGDLHTKLLLHGDSFLDGSKDKRVITNTGVAVSTAQSKFGDSSFYFDGSAYLTAPGYDFGAEDFTIDWWEYATNASAGTRFTSNFCTTYSTQAGGILLYANEDGLKVYASSATNNNWDLIHYQPSGANALNEWVHRAVVRNGNTLMLFVNGTLEYSYTLSGSIGYNSNLPMGIGSWAVDAPGSNYFFTGYIDEFRVSDIARWTESFEPPTEPYLDSNIEILPGGVIPQNYALRRRMMMAGGGGVPISDLPLGALINVGTDGGAGAPNYEIADKDNLVSGGVVLVRKNIYSESKFGLPQTYPDGTLDNLVKTTIYNQMPQKLRDKMMDVSFELRASGVITRKMFVLTSTMVGLGDNNGVTEGKALQLYTSNASRVKTLNGSAANWWLSSKASSYYAYNVHTSGVRDDYGSQYSELGVVPAFVISSKTPYDPTPNTDGSYNLIL